MKIKKTWVIVVGLLLVALMLVYADSLWGEHFLGRLGIGKEFQSKSIQHQESIPMTGHVKVAEKDIGETGGIEFLQFSGDTMVAKKISSIIVVNKSGTQPLWYKSAGGTKRSGEKVSYSQNPPLLVKAGNRIKIDFEEDYYRSAYVRLTGPSRVEVWASSWEDYVYTGNYNPTITLTIDPERIDTAQRVYFYVSLEPLPPANAQAKWQFTCSPDDSTGFVPPLQSQPHYYFSCHHSSDRRPIPPCIHASEYKLYVDGAYVKSAFAFLGISMDPLPVYCD